MNDNFQQQTREFNINLKWQQISLPEEKLRPLVVKSDCSLDDTEKKKKKNFKPCKTFVRVSGQEIDSFCAYIRAIKSGKINLQTHIKLCMQIEKQRTILERIYRQDIIVLPDQLEIPFLHFVFDLR